MRHGPHARPLRVLVAPDGFGGTLTAAEAASAIADGWARARGRDTVVAAPQSDGGPGFVDVLGRAIGLSHAELRRAEVTGPLGVPVGAQWLRAGTTAYIESAQACGLHLLGRPPDPETAREATSFGVGELMARAVAEGAERMVVGLGGSAGTDGGAGAAEAFGGLRRMRGALDGVDLIAAADVRSPLLGTAGAAAMFGPQKGADSAEAVRLLEERLREWSAVLLAETGVDVRDCEGAGAAGGLGGLLIALGGRVHPGAGIVGDFTGRRAAIGGADVVLTGEGRLDAGSARGKVVGHVADEGAREGTRVVAIAGRIALEESEWRRMGIDEVWSVAEIAGSADEAMARPAALVSEAARCAARAAAEAA
ncbi:glycerate kinase [Tomitella fengzijianii]|uniref:Glycerate kinase n=1 Tax=Tomitella fengzijianii TaxID=2597660 RepID=A0A516X8A8_9ACTN|nr:glycerate kinase [Tomitella fengzijianii]QDQ99306.1 glycerate kinase [Tomitella fengzijianii]